MRYTSDVLHTGSTESSCKHAYHICTSGKNDPGICMAGPAGPPGPDTTKLGKDTSARTSAARLKTVADKEIHRIKKLIVRMDEFAGAPSSLDNAVNWINGLQSKIDRADQYEQDWKAWKSELYDEEPKYLPSLTTQPVPYFSQAQCFDF